METRQRDDGGPLVLPFLQSVLTLVVGRPPGGEASVAERLTALYAPVLGPNTSTLWAEREHVHATAFVTGRALPQSLPNTVVMGPSTAGDGAGLRRRQLEQVFEEPSRSGLDGPFVAVRLGEDRVDLVTAGHGVRPVYCLRTGAAAVWSTKGLAAHVAAGIEPQISAEAVPDLILLDYVLDEDDLLQATTVPADALHVRATRSGVESSHWLAIADRFAPGPPTNAKSLRAVLGSAMVRVAEIPGAKLGLTAGRDSTLALSCLHEQAGTMATFTLGWPGDGDAEGATAAAAAAGCPHDLVPSTVHDPADRQWLDASRWTEGQVIARNLLVSGFAWSARDVTWVTGSGGEIGRAFYGQYFTTGGAPRDRWRSHFVDPHRSLLPQPVLNLFEERVGHAMDKAWSIRPEAVGAADLFYFMNRMGKWFGRTRYIEQFAGIHPIYLAPAVAQALFNIPEAHRLSGRTFDDALAAGPVDLHAVATDAVLRKFGGAAEAAPHRKSRLASGVPPALRSLARKGRSRLPHRRGTPHPEWAQLEPLCQRIEAEGSIVIDLMGARWWRHQIASAPHWPGEPARRALWNAIAVDALQHQLPALSGLVSSGGSSDPDSSIDRPEA